MRRRHVVSVSALLLLGLHHEASADPVAPAPAGNAEYTYCDAKVLSGLWKSSVADSKTRIATKVRAGNAATVNTMLGQARTDALKDPAKRCLFRESGFSYADAEKLAKIWSTTVPDAKTRIERKVTAGSTNGVRSLLASAPGNAPGASNPEDIQAFSTSKFNYCDAKVLAALWKSSVADSKAMIGRKLRSGGGASLASAMSRARADAAADPAKRCFFHESGFAPADAEKLAKLWNVSYPDAKLRIAAKVTAGNGALVRDMLAKAPAAPAPTPAPAPVKK